MKFHFKIVFIFIFLFVYSSRAQVLYSENFEGSLNIQTGLTNGWSKSGLSKDQIFQIGDSSSAYYSINGEVLWSVPNHTKFAYTNDVKCSYTLGGQSCNKSEDRLITPNLNFANTSKSIVLSFDTYFTGKLGSNALLEYSLDNGLNWISFYSISSNNIWNKNYVDLTFLQKKSNVLIAFRFNDNNNLRDGLAIDNILISEINPWVDLKIISSDLTKYTSIPSTQLIPLPLKCKFYNDGSKKSDSSQFSLKIYSVISNKKLIKSYIKKYQVINSKDTLEVDFGTVFSNELTDAFEFEFEILDKKDTVSSNNKLNFKTIISLNEYSRDDNSVVGVLGISSQNTITIGNMFEINRPSYIDSVQIHLDKKNMVEGSNIQAVVYPIVNGIPLSNQIGFSSIYSIRATDTLSKLVFKITDTFLSRLKLDSGKYLIAINKYTNGSSLSVKMTNKYFSEDAVFVKIGSANFQTLNTYFSGSYKLVPTIRMYCSPFCNLKALINETKADCKTSLGSLSITPKNGSFPYKYKWSTNSTDSIISNVFVGKYNVNIVDKFGCIYDTQKVVLNYNTPPRITVDSIFHPTCYGSKDGYVSLKAIDKNRLTKIFWNKEQTNTIFHTGLTSGNYNVKVFNEANCYDSIEVKLSSPDSLNVTYTSAPETPKEKGEIFLFVKGGVPPYTYLWNDSLTQKNRTGLNGDTTYSVEVKDLNGCFKKMNFNIQKIVGLENSLLSEINVYPNPSTGIFNILNAEGEELVIENIEGKKLETIIVGQSVEQIDLSYYAKGIYFLNLTSKNRFYKIKISII